MISHLHTASHEVPWDGGHFSVAWFTCTCTRCWLADGIVVPYFISGIDWVSDFAPHQFRSLPASSFAGCIGGTKLQTVVRIQANSLQTGGVVFYTFSYTLHWLHWLVQELQSCALFRAAHLLCDGKRIDLPSAWTKCRLGHRTTQFITVHQLCASPHQVNKLNQKPKPKSMSFCLFLLPNWSYWSRTIFLSLTPRLFLLRFLPSWTTPPTCQHTHHNARKPNITSHKRLTMEPPHDSKRHRDLKSKGTKQNRVAKSRKSRRQNGNVRCIPSHSELKVMAPWPPPAVHLCGSIAMIISPALWKLHESAVPKGLSRSKSSHCSAVHVAWELRYPLQQPGSNSR